MAKNLKEPVLCSSVVDSYLRNLFLWIINLNYKVILAVKINNVHRRIKNLLNCEIGVVDPDTKFSVMMSLGLSFVAVAGVAERRAFEKDKRPQLSEVL